MQPSQYVVPLVLGILGAGIWALALTDVLQRPDWEFPSLWPGRDDRTIWIFVVVFFSAIGSLFYDFKVMRPYPRQRR